MTIRVRAILAAEPAPVHVVPQDRFDAALSAIADFTDLKSVWLRGHSSGVARLVVAAASAAGLPPEQGTLLGRAALVHDVGRVGVPSGIWDRPDPLNVEQWERVRMHPYLTERVLHRCAALAPLADVAGRHHERADGTGYHRGATGAQLDVGARLLAAADAFHAMTEDRPHRPALDAAAAAAQLRDEAGAGRLGRREVDAVLAAAGQAGTELATANPAALTDREVEVLRLIARGKANKQVATELGISAKTVGHHIEHIYAKTRVSTPRRGRAVGDGARPVVCSLMLRELRRRAVRTKNRCARHRPPGPVIDAHRAGRRRRLARRPRAGYCMATAARSSAGGSRYSRPSGSTTTRAQHAVGERRTAARTSATPPCRVGSRR